MAKLIGDQLVDCALGFWIEIPLYYF